VSRRRLAAEWSTKLGTLRIEEPSRATLLAASPDLAVYYNDPENAALLGNSVVFSASEVLQFWADAAAEGGRPFLLWRDGVLVGDGDYRNVSGGAAELALLIGPRSAQGVGLGGHFVLMLLALGFEALRLEEVYVAIRPTNVGSLRLFERTGFVRDDGPAARFYAEEEDDVCLRLGKPEFGVRHAASLREIQTREP
jgi:RimJ/RimL family protein N-acetyltransferase